MLDHEYTPSGLSKLSFQTLKGRDRTRFSVLQTAIQELRNNATSPAEFELYLGLVTYKSDGSKGFDEINEAYRYSLSGVVDDKGNSPQINLELHGNGL